MSWRSWIERIPSPENWAHRLEAKDPQLAKHLLSYASRIWQRDLLGSDFKVTEWSDERVGVEVSQRADRPAGTLLTLAEFMLRTLLGRHWPDLAGLVVIRAELSLLGPMVAVRSMRYELNADEREEWMRQSLLANSEAREIVVWIWGKDDQRLGEVRLHFHWRRRPALPEPG